MMTGERKSRNDSLRALGGPIGDAANIYFPNDLVGGTCSRIEGDEAQTVWNAATEACGTERVYVVWQAVGNTIWYLASKADDLAAHANSWCPFAALLPTDKKDLPICYTHYGTYFGEDIAILMVVTADELRIFRSTPVMIRAKAERVARELGDSAKVINIDFTRIAEMTPVPWYSLSLFEDRARRILATASVFVSLLIAGGSFLVWLTANMAMLSSTSGVAEAEASVREKSMRLLENAEDLRASPLRAQIKSFMDVNEGVIALNGVLSFYEVSDGKARWRAVVPAGVAEDRLSAMEGKKIGTLAQGVAIGNEAQIEYEAARGKE